MSENSFRIVPVDATNAHFVGTVFHSIYGEDFPVKYVYQPELVLREIAGQRLAACLAFTETEQPAGYISLFPNAPNPHLWEGGNLIVNPAYKHTDLALELFQHYFKPSSALQGDGIYSEAVCHHYFSQVNCIKAGMSDCAIVLDQLASDIFKDGRTESDRIACVWNFWELTASSAGAEYLPPQYADILQKLAQPLQPRAFAIASAPLPRQGNTVQTDTYHASVQTWKISIEEIGSDWQSVLEQIDHTAAQRQVISLQLIINTACPHIGAAVQAMQQQGFFFGGLVPRWFGTDGVLMQKVYGKEPDFAGIKLYTQTAKELLAYIRTDRVKVLKALAEPAS